MRSPEQIFQKIQELNMKDHFGFQREVMLGTLPFEFAKPLLKEGTTAEMWDDARNLGNDHNIIEEMREYMIFGWEKAQNERGVSATRTVCKMMGWL